MGKIVKILFVVLFFLAAFLIIRPEKVAAQACVETYSCQQYVSRTCFNSVYTCGNTPVACWQYIGGIWRLNVCYEYRCSSTLVPWDCSYWQTGTCTRPCATPTVSYFYASPSTVANNGSITLHWGSTNAAVCWGNSGKDFAGFLLVPSGSKTITGLTSSQTFTISCWNSNMTLSSSQSSVYVAVQPPAPPIVTSFTASPNIVEYNGSTTLTWASQNTAACWGYAGKDFAGFLLVPSGSKTITGLTSSQTFTIGCMNSNMSLSSPQSSTYVTVQAQRGLTAATQTCIGGSWITTNSNACLARSSCTQIVACVPNCAGKTCGSDGCSGVCGTCTSPLTCGGGGNANLCGCTPTTSCAAQGRTCGSINNGCGIEVCGGACPVCGDGVCSGGETAATCPSDCGNILSGTVYADTAGNSCASGATTYSGGATVTLYAGASPSGSGVSNGSGTYSFISTIPAGQKTATISNVSSTVGAVRYQGGAWGTTNLSGFTYGPFTHNSSQSLDWCLTDIKPWYQVDRGDVREVSLANKVPAGQYLSTDVNYPGVAISSAWSTDFGTGQASVKNWKIDDEYSYNKNSLNKNGTAAYSYYKNRVANTNQTISAIPGCANGGSTSCSISNLTSGIYEFDGGGTGTLTITGYTQRPGAHITLLINGNVTIASNVLIPEGASNLLVLAAKGNITIDRSVGQVSASSQTTNIDGIYSAEGKITIDGDACIAGSPDRRLNVGGVLIANSRKPFTTGGIGIIDNKRSLCAANDAQYPSLYVRSRFDFLFQLTDFYLVPTGRYSQVQP
jgi:hypothetical protein